MTVASSSMGSRRLARTTLAMRRPLAGLLLWASLVFAYSFPCDLTVASSCAVVHRALLLTPGRSGRGGPSLRAAPYASFQERGCKVATCRYVASAKAPHARGLRISRGSADTTARLLGDAVPSLARVAGVERLRRPAPAGAEAGPTTTSARATESLAVTLASAWAEPHLVHVGLSMAAAPRVANLSGLLLTPSDRRRGDSHSSDEAARSDLSSARSVLRSTVAEGRMTR
jgi:hypothetical protein